MNTKKITIRILYVTILFFVASNAEIIEIRNISEINKYANSKKTLVILDIDNTILEPNNKTGIGSDQWFSEMVKREQQNGLNEIEAIEKTVPQHHKIHETIKVKPVEKDTIEVIKNLQTKKISVMALTARSFPMINTTFRQFKDIDLNLTSTSLSKQSITFKNCQYPAKFNNGVLFVGNNNKGEVLKTYLSTIKVNPKKIIMVDDKRHHLEKIEEKLKDTNMSFIGLRYSYLDEKVKNFRLKNCIRNKLRDRQI